MDVALALLLALTLSSGDRADGTRLIRSPAEDLESKIREGLAKKVDPARILDAVRQRRESFRTLGAHLDRGLRDAGREGLEGEVRYETVLEMHRAVDLGLGREGVPEILREALRPRGADPADFERLPAVFRFAGVACGSGMPPDQAVRIVRAGLGRGYSAQDFRLSCRRILDLRERLGSRYPSRDVGAWMEEGVGRYPDCRGMLDFVLIRSEPPR